MAGEIGKRLLELQVEYVDAVESDQLGWKLQQDGGRGIGRTIDEIATEYEDLLRQLLTDASSDVRSR